MVNFTASPWIPIYIFSPFHFNTPFRNYETSRMSFSISINNSVHLGQDKWVCSVCVCVCVWCRGQTTPPRFALFEELPSKAQDSSDTRAGGPLGILSLSITRPERFVWNYVKPWQCRPLGQWHAWPCGKMILAKFFSFICTQFQSLIKRQQINLWNNKANNSRSNNL